MWCDLKWSGVTTTHWIIFFSRCCRVLFLLYNICRRVQFNDEWLTDFFYMFNVAKQFSTCFRLHYSSYKQSFLWNCLFHWNHLLFFRVEWLERLLTGTATSTSIHQNAFLLTRFGGWTLGKPWPAQDTTTGTLYFTRYIFSLNIIQVFMSVFFLHRFAKYYHKDGVEYRSLIKAFGIRLDVIVHGHVRSGYWKHW